MMRKIFNLIFIVALLFAMPGSALAQDYYFELEKNYVDVYWNEDGTSSLAYTMVFNNDPSGHPIEFVDLETGVVEVGQLLRQQPVILLCVCADVQRCHRLAAAEAIAARYGVIVEHC